MDAIFETLDFIKGRINNSFGFRDGEEGSVELGNVAQLDSSIDLASTNISNHIILSLVNICEETTLKNGSFYKRNGNTNSLHHRNPSLNLNLYLLFSANNNDYDQSLRSISRIVSFFQARHVFRKDNAPNLPKSIDKLVFEIYSMGFENLNNMWGFMGGKYLPSVVYLVRLLSIQEDHSTKGTVIDKIGEFPKLI